MLDARASDKASLPGKARWLPLPLAWEKEIFLKLYTIYIVRYAFNTLQDVQE